MFITLKINGVNQTLIQDKILFESLSKLNVAKPSKGTP